MTEIVRELHSHDLLPFSITKETRGFGQSYSFGPLLMRFSRKIETLSRGSGVRAPVMYQPFARATQQTLRVSDRLTSYVVVGGCNGLEISPASAERLERYIPFHVQTLVPQPPLKLSMYPFSTGRKLGTGTLLYHGFENPAQAAADTGALRGNLFPNALKTWDESAEIVKQALRELAGRPQPGESVASP
jgi:hypothetical protein